MFLFTRLMAVFGILFLGIVPMLDFDLVSTVCLAALVICANIHLAARFLIERMDREIHD